MPPIEVPIEDPHQRLRRLPSKPTRRIGLVPPRSGIDAANTPHTDTLHVVPQPSRPQPALIADVELPLRPQPAGPVSVEDLPQPQQLEAPVQAAATLLAADPVRKIQPRQIERITTKKVPNGKHTSGTSFTSAVSIILFSAALIGYAFNIASIQSTADSTLAKLNTSAQAQGPAIIPMVSRAIPWLLLLPVVILFYAIMRTLARAIGLTRKSKIEEARQIRKRPLDEFKAAMYAYGITSRTAYQGFLLLTPYLKEQETPEPTARLEEDLGMTAPKIREVYFSLLRATGRECEPDTRVPQLNTILDLVTEAQRAPKQARGPIDPVFLPGDPGRK